MGSSCSNFQKNLVSSGAINQPLSAAAMSKVQINNVVVLNNPAAFGSAFQFQITFDCMENLEDDLEWKLTYVGSAESSAHDQILDTIYVGPVPEGRHMFVFQVDFELSCADATNYLVVNFV